MEFQHFVLTRFNLNYTTGNFAVDKSGQKTQTEEWLEQRFELFDQFCFPSLANQTNKNFIWLVFFSDETSEKFRLKIKAYQSQLPSFTPVFLSTTDDYNVPIRMEISNRLTQNTSYLLTTRIDNDDSFHEKMIESIQKQFDQQEGQILSFDNGLQYDISNQLLGEVYYPFNAFLSFIEKIVDNQFKTIYFIGHFQSRRYKDVKQVKTFPAWLQIIHKGNISNSLRITKFHLSDTSLKAFHLQFPTKISVINTSVFMFTRNFKRLSEGGKKLAAMLKNRLRR